MKGISSKDEGILSTLSQYPQGLFLWQIQEKCEIKRKQYALYYMTKLIKKGYVKKARKLYFIQGNIDLVGLTKHITKPITQRQKTQRLHAMQINAGLYRTSADNVEATLQALSIPYTQPVPKQYVITYKGIKMKITTRKIISYPSQAELPQAINGDSLREAIIARQGNVLEEFLDYTGLRCIRKITGELILEFRYWENGFPENDIAEEQLKEETRIIYAYDAITGNPSIWADSSLNPFKELETNSKRAEKEFKQYFQAIDDGYIKPYHDELETRKTHKAVKEFIGSQTLVNQALSQTLNMIQAEMHQAQASKPTKRNEWT